MVWIVLILPQAGAWIRLPLEVPSSLLFYDFNELHLWVHSTVSERPLFFMMHVTGTRICAKRRETEI